MNFRFNNRSVLINERAKILLNRISKEQSLNENKDLNLNLKKIYDSFNDLYNNIGKPFSVIEPFEPKQVPRSAKLNKSMSDIEADIETAYKEIDVLGTSFIEVFNYSKALSTELSNSSEKLRSKVIDLQFLAGQENQNTIVAGDDFNDLSKIDSSFATQNQRADVSISQGIVSLPKIESVNVVDENTTISVVPLSPQLSTRPTVGNDNRFYEGKFYDFIGNARPEGGNWHLEETASVSIPLSGQSSTLYVSNGIPSVAQLDPFIGNENTPPAPGQRLRPQDVIVYDRGASEESKAQIRNRILDGNPATFWECEYVKTAPEVQNEVDAAKLVSPNEAGLSSSNNENTLISTVTLDDLRNKSAIISNGSGDDFTIQMTIGLQNKEVINWISINPNNFEESAWIEVTNIEYLDGSNYKTISNFSSNIHENVLTDSVNSELTSQEKSTILSPNKYNYKGIGIWTFDPVLTNNIRLTIKQKTAVPSPYQRMAISLHRVFTQVYTESQGSDGMM